MIKCVVMILKRVLAFLLIFAVTALITAFICGKEGTLHRLVRFEGVDDNEGNYHASYKEGKLNNRERDVSEEDGNAPTRYGSSVSYKSNKHSLLNDELSDSDDTRKFRMKAISSKNKKLRFAPRTSDNYVENDFTSKSPHRTTDTHVFNHGDNMTSLIPDDEENHQKRGNDVKKIFFFNRRPFVKLQSFRFRTCEYACALTSSIEDADVVMIGGNSFKMNPVKKMPEKKPGQIWVVYTRESPDVPSMQYLDRPDLHNKVNYTRMVYSDATWPTKYGSLKTRPLPRKNYTNIYRNKQYDAAWFVSQCDRPSRRMEYTKRLMAHLNVHVFGRCGNMTCGQTGAQQKENCMDMLSSKYKFYLAFENSFCRDYVSEKFFHMFSDVDTIPVVRGGANYSALFPDGRGSGAYVDASNFPNPESLGKYLHELASDEKRYVEMLKAKNRYMEEIFSDNYKCDLCKRAHTGTPAHVYGDLSKWLQSGCWPPTDLDSVNTTEDLHN